MSTKYVDNNAVGLCQWWICSECGRRNKLGRKINPEICSKCGEPLVRRSFWPSKTRGWILQRDHRRCALHAFSHLDEIGTCEGLLQVVHLRPRQHGGSQTNPANGITLCRKHADWLITGRSEAREFYPEDHESFRDWHQEFLYISPSHLPKKVRQWRIFLVGIAWERTRTARERERGRRRGKKG